MEKSSQDLCVGSVPFDYSILENSGRASDLRSNVPPNDLKTKEPESLSTEIPVLQHDETIETNKLTVPNDVNINDDIFPEHFKGLLNRKSVRESALKLINDRFPTTEGRPQRFCRVSEKFIDALEALVRTELVLAIGRHPSPLLTNTVKQF